MDPQAYLTAIKAKLVSSALVSAIDIVQEYMTLDLGYFRARLTLYNDDFVEVAEYFQVVQGQIETVEYRYQWMDPERQTLRKRWDNAGHYPDLPNFPHHVHVGSTGRVEPGRSLNTVELVDLIGHELGV